MATPSRVDVETAIHCEPSQTNFIDLTEDCQRVFFNNVPLNQRMQLRAVCSQWKGMIEETFKGIKKLRIFDSRQSLIDYSHALSRTAHQHDPDLSFGPYDTLIIKTPRSVVEAEKLRLDEETAKKNAEMEKKKMAEKKQSWPQKEKNLTTELGEARKRVRDIENSIDTGATTINAARSDLKKAKINYNNAWDKLHHFYHNFESTALFKKIRRTRGYQALVKRILSFEAEHRYMIVDGDDDNEAEEDNNGVHNGDNAVAGEPNRGEEQFPYAIRRLAPPEMNLMQPNLIRRNRFFFNRAQERVEKFSLVLKYEYTDLSGFIRPLFPEVSSLAIWTNYIICTPGQLDVAKLISAWKSTLQVLSVIIYSSGKPEEYYGIDMTEFIVLRKNQLEAISNLSHLRRLHIGESERSPNHHIPLNFRSAKYQISRYHQRCSLQLPTSVERLTLNFRVFDTYTHMLIKDLQKKATHVTEMDVTYMRNNTKFLEPRCLLMDLFLELPDVVKLRVDICTLETELNSFLRGNRQLNDQRRKVLSTGVVETMKCVSLTDRFNFLHNNTREVNYNSPNFRMQAEIFRSLGVVFPKLQSLTMVSKYADDEDYQNFVRTLVYSNCPMHWGELLNFEKVKAWVPLDKRLLQFWPVPESPREDIFTISGQFCMPSQSDFTQVAASSTDKKRRSTREGDKDFPGPLNKRIRFTEGDEVLEEDETEVEIAADKLRFSLTQADELISFFSEEEFEEDGEDNLYVSDSSEDGKDGEEAPQSALKSLPKEE